MKFVGLTVQWKYEVFTNTELHAEDFKSFRKTPGLSLKGETEGKSERIKCMSVFARQILTSRIA